MSDFKEYAELFKLIHGDLQVESNEEKEGIIIFSLAPGELRRIDFDLIVYKCKRIGYLPFTVEDEPDKLFVIKLEQRENSRLVLRMVLFVITIISIIYAGYAYSALYNSTSTGEVITTDLLTFFLPMAGFLFFRELGRFFARKSSGMSYSFPILIPDPLFFGTGGSISTSDDVYKDRKTMIECGGAPILFGFVYSIFIIVVGGFINPTYPLSGPVGSMPYTSIGYPVAFYYFFSFAIPMNGFINPMVFVGWVGLFVSALNFVPIGFLDGGLFWKGLLGKKFKFVSYASAVALIGLGLIYPELIIIPVFSIFLGLNGAEPLNGNTPLPHYASASLVAISIVILVSMVPIHHLPSQIKLSVQVMDPTILVDNESNGTGNFSVKLVNTGNAPVDPSFSFFPTLQVANYSVSNLQPGSSETITFYANTSGMTPGRHNFTFTVYSGTYYTTSSLTFISVDETKNLLFNNQHNPYSVHNYRVGNPLNLTLVDDTSSEINITLYVITSTPIAFTMSIDASQFYKESSNSPGSPLSFNSFQITPFANTSMQFTAKGSAQWTEIVAVTANYSAAICYIDAG